MLAAMTGPARPSRQDHNAVSRAWVRHLRLSAALTSAGYTAQRFRSLRISGALLAVTGVASVVLVARVGAADVADIVALRIMAYSCWLYGALGLWVVLSPEAHKSEPSALARLRGQVLDSPFIRAIGIARRLTLGMLLASLPGLTAAVVVSPSGSVLMQRAALFLITILYLASLGAVLGGVGALSARLAPRAPRFCALVLVILPFLLSYSAAEIPSIPGVYSWALGQLIEWGAVS
jgi:hypothetical protein